MKDDDKIISKKCVEKLTKYLHNFITITQEIVRFSVLFRTILFSTDDDDENGFAT